MRFIVGALAMAFTSFFLRSWLMGVSVLAGAPVGAGDSPDAGRKDPTYCDRQVAKEDLVGRSLDDLSVMRDTIYAHAGLRFDDPKLVDYFGRQPWYRPGPPFRLRPVDAENLRAIAMQERILLLRPTTFPCPKAQADGTVVDRRTVATLVALAGKLPWNDDYGLPECHRRVKLWCGPDLDGDGQPESIVRIEGYVLLNGKSCEANMTDSNDFWPIAKTFVATGRLKRGRALQMLGTDIHGDQKSESATASFVRLSDGRVAIEVLGESFDGGDGCGEAGSTIYAVERGKLRIIKYLPNSLPCDLQ